VRHTVLLVEDDPATRARIATALAAHPQLELLGAVGSCAEAFAALSAREPEVLLTDYGLPDGDGVQIIRRARELGYRTASMVITIFGDEQRVIWALEQGALGYLLKDGDEEQITRGVLDLVAGGSPVSPGIARYLLKRLSAPAAQPAGESPPAGKLTPREAEVLGYIAKGFTYKEMAELAGVSPHTINTHVRHIYEKLEVTSRSEAVFEAAQIGLVKLGR